LIAIASLLAACTAPAAKRPAAATPHPSVVVPSPAAPTTATPTRTGPPPKKGTIAWYVDELPHFDPAPAPKRVETIATTGPGRQVNRVDVGKQKVAFITIDDGWLKDPAIVTILRAAHIPFTMFLTTDAIKSDPGYFTTLQGLGGVIEDHTISHPKLSTETYAQQVHEICASKATLTRLYGRAPVIMRAPYGLSDKNTLKAAASCGIRSNVFWDEYAITGTVTWQRPGGILPGDMVLMHFDTYLKDNLLSTLKAFHKAGITPALLENYLVTAPKPAVP
jgi:peptidoglycan/xylan/chitin deacetylase (PgdA/CDA1 family)